MRCPAPLMVLVAALALSASQTARADDDVFEVVTLETEGRTVASELVDLDGDGRSDLFQVSLFGIPPNEQRLIRVYLQSAEGGLPSRPSFETPLPPGSAAYDFADLRETPGIELILLERGGARIVSLASRAGKRWEIPVPAGTTLGAAPDERGLERLDLVWDELGTEPRLVLPIFGYTAILSPEGALISLPETGARANFFIPQQPGLTFIESDVQIFFDAPRLQAGDVDGDGRTDLLASSRHELRVFLQAEDGSFASQPDRIHGLGLISEKDHMRGSGGVATEARDIDGDGRVDLVISLVAGSFTDARSETRVLLNRGGTWNFEKPDRVFSTDKSLGASTALDIDGDGRLELVRAAIPFSVFQLIESLVTRAVDVEIEIYRYDPKTGLATDSWVDFELDIPIDFDTFRPAGFIAQGHSDINGDGSLDLVRSGGGEAVEVYLGGGKKSWKKRAARQKMSTAGIMRLGDLNGDGLYDLLIFDPTHKDVPIHIAINRGRLPGTPPSLTSRARGG